MPLRVLISVLLPAPLSPTRPTISPACTASETPDSDCTPPNHLTMSRHCRTTRLAPFVSVPLLMVGSSVTRSARGPEARLAAQPPASASRHWPGGTLPVAVGVLRYLKYLLNTYAYFGLSGSKAILLKLFACSGVTIVRPNSRRVGLMALPLALAIPSFAMSTML